MLYVGMKSRLGKKDAEAPEIQIKQSHVNVAVAGVAGVVAGGGAAACGCMLAQHVISFAQLCEDLRNLKTANISCSEEFWERRFVFRECNLSSKYRRMLFPSYAITIS
jgi:hypothetical protein